MPRKTRHRKHAIVAIILLLLCAVYVALVEYAEDHALEHIQRIVSKRCEGTLKIGQLNLYPLRGQVAIDDVSLTQGTNATTVAECRRMTIRFRLLRSITSRSLSVRTVRLKDAVLHIERDANGRIKGPGLGALAVVLANSSADLTRETSGSRKAPPVNIEQLLFDGTIHYTDAAVSPDAPLIIDLQTTASLDRFHHLSDGRLATDLALTGTSTLPLKITLSGKALIDPALKGPDITLSGKIDPVPPLYIYALDQYGISAGHVRANLALEANEGNISSTRSYISLALTGVTYSGEAAALIPPTTRSIPTVGLRVPLSGSVAAPQADLSQAIQHTVQQLITGSSEMSNAAKEFLSGE